MPYSSGVYAQSCEPAAASVISVQGDVDVSDSDRAHWRDVQLNQVLCGGQQVRLMANSRAVLQLPNETLIHLDEGSVFTLRAIEPDKPAWLDLLRGALHIISRVPRALNIRTPLVNAGIEGTEFALRVQNEEAALWVYEGRVRFSNTLGQVLIASGEAAAAAPGRPPERRIVIKPRRAVEWALYYPPLLDTRPERYPEPLRAALAAYRQNDLPTAFARLEALSPENHTGIFFTLRAGLFLSVGRVAEAERDIAAALRGNPKEGAALALRAVIAVVRNETAEALRLAQEAVTAEPRSSTPYVARSYAEQSAFDIASAGKSLEEASRLAPEDALVWARLSEIKLSLGDLDASLEAARNAEQIDPGLSRTQSVLGFAYLTRIEINRAKTAFERAMALDPADPLPRLGLGLARIRDGDLDAGTEEIEIAASLDPNNSLVRSYLGKAYYEQKRGGLASTEFEQAKLLDPKDPTPWFYDAIQKQTTNRPVEALHDLQKAIDLNDNRAVYRSKLLLDQDLAARSAALGRIYGDLGFEQLALVEGWKSVNTDPANYSAHRLLADSYSALPRHQIARVSELLQSQLLQPLNITPVQPQLAEGNLLILDGAGPSDPSFNEFNPLFLRDRFALQSSGVAGSNNTFGDELVQSGVQGKVSYSLGQFHYETDGFRDNNDLVQDIYNVFAQAQISPTIDLQAEYRHREAEHGDLNLFFDPGDIKQTFRRTLRTDVLRFGAHFALAPHSDVIASVIHLDEVDNINNMPVDTTNRGYLGELQYLLRTRHIDLIAGGGHFSGDQEDTRFPFGHADVRHTNGYFYSYWRYPETVTWTLGMSVDVLDDPFIGKRDLRKVNPKVGILWDVTPSTTLRFAAFNVLKRSLPNDQTVEPTQLAGFNQFFDDVNATRATRYGVGLDHKFSPNLYGGLEASKRELAVPIAQGDAVLSDDWEEETYRAYWHWAPRPYLAVAAQYELEEFARDIEDRISDPLPRTVTHTAPISVRFFDPRGFFADVTTTYVNQQVDFFSESFSGEDDFAIVDLGIGYRLPKRYGIVRVEANNLFDQEFRYQGPNIRTVHDDSPRFIPDRTYTLQITLAF